MKMTAASALGLFYCSLFVFYVVAMAFTVSWWRPMDPRDIGMIEPPHAHGIA